MPRMDPVAIVADVTEMESRPPVHPEHVAELEARGYQLLGRFATLSRPTRDDRAYGRVERARLDEWRQRPAASVLVAPDGSSFAGVDTFGDARMLRLRSELDDGSVVETVGIERPGVLKPRWGRDPLATFTAVATPDHAVRVLQDPSADAVIAEHADHVSLASGRRGAQPVRHTDRDHALRLASLHADHMSRVLHRWRRLLISIAVPGLVLLGAFFMWLEVGNGVGLGTALLLDLAMALVAVLGIIAIAVPLSRARWWRPPYLVDR